jgi:hypothetical protein
VVDLRGDEGTFFSGIFKSISDQPAMKSFVDDVVIRLSMAILRSLTYIRERKVVTG